MVGVLVEIYNKRSKKQVIKKQLGNIYQLGKVVLGEDYELKRVGGEMYLKEKLVVAKVKAVKKEDRYVVYEGKYCSFKFMVIKGGKGYEM